MKINSIETSFIPSEMELSKGGETVCFSWLITETRQLIFYPVEKN
ncbi:hypothetical protein ADICYQ_1685 [Cyclobacterium qasimii M12-11B]|uniref:Uncharacterized protein n=1 Tax=Cyclobacterium qasimii M12-11B TaxID=641524 RepID=S7VG67_9BACT|nr:hypothetical protein ADICYQ_1685 [Cyclobacterium qasimii M12-11B]